MAAEDSQHACPSDAPTPGEEALNMRRGQLTRYGIELTPDGLVAGLKHEEAAARAACLGASAWVFAKPENLDKVPTVVPAIAELCDDPVRFVRVQALRTLHTITTAYLQSKAERIWKESERPADRFQAAVLVNRLGDPKHYEVVLDVLQDPANSLFVQAVRRVPRFAERRILKADGQPVDWESILSDLLLRDDLSSKNKFEVASALRQIGSAAAMASIKKALEKEQDPELKQIMKYLLGEK